MEQRAARRTESSPLPRPTISVVIPAYNEAERIGGTVRAVRELRGIDEIVVVDDGSTDDTSRIAAEAGARVVRCNDNEGKGGALSRGVDIAAGGVVVLLDADLGASASQAGLLLQPILDSSADMTIATFPVVPGRGGGFGLAVGLARSGILRLTGREMAAPLSGQRAIRREVLDAVGGFATGFGAEVALTVDAIRAGFRVVEVPTAMTHRVTGRDISSIFHRFRQFIAVAKALRQRRRG